MQREQERGGGGGLRGGEGKGIERAGMRKGRDREGKGKGRESKVEKWAGRRCAGGEREQEREGLRGGEGN